MCVYVYIGCYVFHISIETIRFFVYSTFQLSTQESILFELNNVVNSPKGPFKTNASCTELSLSSFMEICRRCLPLPTNKPHGLILFALDVRNVRWLLHEPPALYAFMHPSVHCKKKIAFSLEKICTSDVWFFITMIYRWFNDRGIVSISIIWNHS